MDMEHLDSKKRSNLTCEFRCMAIEEKKPLPQRTQREADETPPPLDFASKTFPVKLCDLCDERF
jgi:hypothetical protein